jgi:hypothetical protein
LQPFNAAFWNFAQMGCDGSALLAGILFLRKSLIATIEIKSDSTWGNCGALRVI